MQCRECGNNLESLHASKKYCSMACKKRYLKRHGGSIDSGHNCRMCGTWFPLLPGQGNKWLCSDACRKASNAKSVREFHRRKPEAEKIYRRRTKKRIQDSLSRRFYQWNPHAPKHCEACGEDRVLDVAHRPESPRLGERRSRSNCKWPEHVWVLCPTCHTLLDRIGYSPKELGLS